MVDIWYMNTELQYLVPHNDRYQVYCQIDIILLSSMSAPAMIMNQLACPKCSKSVLIYDPDLFVDKLGSLHSRQEYQHAVGGHTLGVSQYYNLDAVLGNRYVRSLFLFNTKRYY